MINFLLDLSGCAMQEENNTIIKRIKVFFNISSKDKLSNHSKIQVQPKGFIQI
jgi:hypothetical protein